LCDESRVALYRQPIVDLARGVTAGFELLARFDDAVVQAPPHLWFGAAYRLGLGPQLEAAVLRKALRLREEAPPNTFLTVNLDPAALVHPEVAGLLLDSPGLERLVIELTEHSEIEDFAHLNGLLDRLRKRGASVAVDDAGTGYANLVRLLAVRPQFVKVDQAFVRGMGEDPAKRALVELVGHFASRIDAWVIAEGIESESDLREVVALGVPLGQGYLLNRPAPGFVPVPGPMRELIRRYAESGEDGPTVAGLIEPVEAMRREDWDAGEEGTVVLLDRWNRPVAVVYLGRSAQPLLATPSCRPADVLRRALVRPERERFHPIVVTNDGGQPLGMVRIERLIENVLGSQTSS
uniref:EAL domain-containing protein n=1 Tax=Tepidiforma sp. TaxID=2682230 RepID=UPI002ADD8906